MTGPLSTLANGLRNWLFEAVQGIDDWMQSRGFKPGRVSRLVGRLEVGYYERTTDWEHPIYVRPEE